VSEFDLAGKICLVTGAGRGIGRAIAEGLARHGATLVLSGRTEATLSEAVAAIGERANVCVADVSREADVLALRDSILTRHGRLDVLVNNAGVYKFFPIQDVTEAEFNRQFGTNVFGLLQVTKEAVALFGPEGGSIINIGSTATSMAVPETSVYTATKGAVDTITPVLAKELAPRKIRVNSINPGGVETEGLHAAGVPGSEFEKQMIAQTPLGRLGQPDDIAPIAVFLASSDSGWLTGEILLASGGLR